MKPSPNYAIFIGYPYAEFLRYSGSLALSYTSGFIILSVFYMPFYWISFI